MLRKRLSVILALVSSTACWAASPGPLPPAQDQELARDILRELIDINTTHDHGSTEAARVIQHQCRMMPGETAENLQATLSRVLDDPKICVTLDAPPVLSPESPPTKEILDKAAKVVHSMWPGVPIVPTMASGFSDGRQTRSAGIPTYDLSGRWADIDDVRAHGRDERIGMREFDESVEYTYRLMKAFAAR